jgi:hypothetical protein
MSVARSTELRKRTPATNHAVLMLDRAEHAAREARATAHETHRRLVARRRLTQRERNALIKRLSKERQDAYEAALMAAAAAYLREVDEPPPAFEFEAVGTPLRDVRGRFTTLA